MREELSPDVPAVVLKLPTSCRLVTPQSHMNNAKKVDEDYSATCTDQKCIEIGHMLLDDSLASVATTVSAASISANATSTPMPMDSRHFVLLQKQMEQHQKSLEEQLARQQQQVMEAIAKVQALLHDSNQPISMQQPVTHNNMFTSNCRPCVRPSTSEIVLPKEADTTVQMEAPETQPVEDMSKLESTTIHVETDCSSMNHSPPDSVTNKRPVNNKLKRVASKAIKKKQGQGGSSALQVLQQAMSRSGGKQDVQQDLDVVEIEEESGACAFVKGPKFDMIIGVAIVLNALTMAVHSEYEGFNTANVLGISPDLASWNEAKMAFDTLEHLFAIFFAAEILLRLAVEGKPYLRAMVNWFDIGIVLVSVVDLYVLSASNVNVVNVSFLRLIRLVRLVKIFRIVRVMRLFRHLRLLVVSVGASIGALGWSMVLLGVIQLISSIFLTQVLHGWLRNNEHDLDTRNEVYSYFGTFSRAWITMFEITLAPGAWGYIGRVLIYKVNRLFFFFFMFYISFVTFAIVRVITAIFLKETLAAADQDHEMVIHEKMHMAQKYQASLERLYHELDTDKDGYVTSDELNTLCEDQRAVAWLHSLDLSVSEVNALFELMDTGDGKVAWNAFVDGLTRLRGSAKNIDLEMLSIDNKKVLSGIKEMQSNVKLIADLVSARTP
eukprot:gnl/MRDRNA2_/MRDRNA2_78428_c0_seq1.p1 gnl/MRDRNA2_/MRDRNA2_78428_c0~~gnl/MRDRNA2_/MRDRNA2_78428_c0_seq1.p1  ORF type:complete len:665 (+),score=119.84 gnl/MRDRNA2_/MRDRNA2_78428_c0_seq1:103-2097(+)